MKLTPRRQEDGSGNREGAWAYFCSGHVPSKEPCHFCGANESHRHLLVEEDVEAEYDNSTGMNASNRMSCCQACTDKWYTTLSMSLLVEADFG